MTTSDVFAYLKKKSKPQAELSKTKQSHKNSYIISQKSSDEKREKHFKTKINASISKTKSIFI